MTVHHQRIAVYGICRHGGQILLARAARRLTVAGQWFLPGGGLHFAEEPLTGLVREFEEETGLSVLPGRLRGVLSDVTTLPNGEGLHTVRLIHDIDTWQGTLRPEADGSTDAVAWMEEAELGDLPLMGYVVKALALP